MADEWARLTVGQLRASLTEMVGKGMVTDASFVFVDSDPEGNDNHPLRNAIEPAPTVMVEQWKDHFAEVLDEDKETFTVPAKALWIGVGY